MVDKSRVKVEFFFYIVMSSIPANFRLEMNKIVLMSSFCKTNTVNMKVFFLFRCLTWFVLMTANICLLLAEKTAVC